MQRQEGISAVLPNTPFNQGPLRAELLQEGRGSRGVSAVTGFKMSFSPGGNDTRGVDGKGMEQSGLLQGKGTSL